MALSNYKPEKRHAVAGRPIAGSYSTYRTVGWVSANGETLVKERMNAGSVSRDGRVVKINNLAVSLFSIALSAQIEFWL